MPPAANSLEAFWKFLLRGGNALKPVRKDRWDWRQFFDEDQKRPGKTYAPKFGMLDADVKLFDPLAFGISPREAACMDPQQRLLLEVTWEAFEDAGIPVERMSGSRTGVFIGGFCLDHLILQMRPWSRHLLNANSPAGATMTVLSNRISHVFNLRGPSLTMDTACSSSLVAIHYACQSLRLGESELALAGGANVMTCPDNPIMMSKGHFLSHHGECHTFDETAAGYARGEGAGVFLIKALGKALADGDPIHAVIRGTGVNQDGHTDGISLPSGPAQEELVSEVYRRAGVAPADVDYVEAHGTGTQAGDPAEAGALNRHFAAGRTRKLLVGSVKTNVGHLEAAAGVAGMLKAIGVLKNRQVPKNLHFEHPNPKIPFDEYCIQVVAENTALLSPAEKPALFAGVNAFGYGGTNAHIILESAPPMAPVDAGNAATGLRVIPFSARSETALRDLAGKFAFQLGQGLPGAFSDFAHTAAFRRSHLEYRCAAVAENTGDLRAQLIATSTGQPHEGIAVGAQPVESTSGLVFVYTGMGPQWWGMGRELLRDEPIVAGTVREIDGIFLKLSGWSLWEAMLADEPLSRMERTEVAQPANFALQIALTRLWESFGIRPSAVVGHSVGEVVSAYVAGVYSLEDATRVSYHRSRLQQTVAGRGAMLAVGLPEAEARKWIENSAGVSIAAVNSFHAVTLSGDAEQLRAVAAELEKREIFQKFLRVEVAYHSPQMDPLKDELLGSLAGLAPRSSILPLYSTAFGKRVPDEKWDAEYWWGNVRQPVHFAQAIQALMEDGLTSFLEVGPHPVLGNSIKECAAHIERKVNVFTSLRRKEPEKKRILLTVAELYCAGHDPDWAALAPQRGQFLPGPRYPWQRQTHWLESERSRMDRLGLPGPVYLNRSIAGPQPAWEVEINRNYFPFLPDHGVQDQTVFAGMGYVEAALTLNQQIHQSAAVVLENVNFEKVLIVDDSKLQYLITAHDPDGGRFTISSRVEGEEDGVLRHCRGRMLPQTESRPPTFDLGKLKAECPRAVAVPDFYQRLQQRGLSYGPKFRPSVEIFVGEDCFFVKMDASDVAGEQMHPLHPTLFDAAIQPVLYCSKGDRLFVPFGIDQFEYYSRPAMDECFVFGRLVSQSETMIVANIWLMDSAGAAHAHARRISCQVIDTEQKAPEKSLFYQLEWRPAPLEETEGVVEGSELIIVTDADDPDQKLAGELAARLPEAVTFNPGTEPAEGLGKDRWVRLIGQESRRHRFVVLWGSPSNKAEDSAESVRDLDERVIGFLQAAGTCLGAADITFVTRRAREVEPGEPIVNLPAASAGALGLVAQNEHEGLRCRTIDTDGDDAGETAGRILAEIRARSQGDIAYRNGARFECVLSAISENGKEAELVSETVEEPVELKLGTKGKLDSLRFERSLRATPGEGEIEIRIHGSALNYKDLLKIDGRIHPAALESTFNGPDFGMECMGVVVRSGPGSQFQPGDRVATILQRGFRTYATVPETFVVRLPEGLGIEAAGIPVVYLAAYRGLVEIARLQPGERVLIHHATGGVGLAAIEISRWIGAEIFATAGSGEKKDFLRNYGIEHVFSSRDLDFGQRIREVTNHEGVDVGIGAQTGQALHLSLGLLRPGGRYIEIGKRDIAEDNGLPLRPFNRNVVFAAVDIDRLTHERPEETRRGLQTIFGHFAKGDFKPGPSRLLPARDIREGFREMAQSRHIGKLVADFSNGEIEILEKPESGPGIRSDGCYVVTGGTSGFGLLTGRWLAEQGAGRVILVSRSGRNAPAFAGPDVSQLAGNPRIEVMAADVTDAGQVRDLISGANAGGLRLRGVIHSAMVLDDVMMAELTRERFRKVFGPKVVGAFHLADALKGNEALDFLVFYSSISAVVGNRGQTSYVAANGALDVLARRLRSEGMPAISINWGALADTGVVARDERLGSVLSSGGITGLGDREALSALDRAIRLAKPQVGIFRVDWKKWHNANPGLAEDPRFREQRVQSQTDNGSDAASQIRRTLVNSSKEQRLRALEDHLQDVLASTLRMSKEGISLKKKLNEMGVDSLMVLELGLGIRERIGVNFSAMEFLKGPTLEQLASLAENKIWNHQGKDIST